MKRIIGLFITFIILTSCNKPGIVRTGGYGQITLETVTGQGAFGDLPYDIVDITYGGKTKRYVRSHDGLGFWEDINMESKRTLKDLDLFIKFTDDLHNKYVVDNFDFTYKLIITFEDWSGIMKSTMGRETPCVMYIAEYVSPGHLSPRVKWQNENLDELLEEVYQWNEKHREGDKARNY